jgi:hypothetical protein
LRIGISKVFEKLITHNGVSPNFLRILLNMILRFELLLLTIVVASPNIKDVQEVIQKAKDICWTELTDQEWVYPTYLGTLFLSEYYFELKALNYTNTQFSEDKFTKILLDTQLEDGSWV